MEKDQKVASEDPKVDLFEDDDEFEEFEINEGISLPFVVHFCYCIGIMLLSFVLYSFGHFWSIEKVGSRRNFSYYIV